MAEETMELFGGSEPVEGGEEPVTEEPEAAEEEVGSEDAPEESPEEEESEEEPEDKEESEEKPDLGLLTSLRPKPEQDKSLTEAKESLEKVIDPKHMDQLLSLIKGYAANEVSVVKAALQQSQDLSDAEAIVQLPNYQKYMDGAKAKLAEFGNIRLMDAFKMVYDMSELQNAKPKKTKPSSAVKRDAVVGRGSKANKEKFDAKKDGERLVLDALGITASDTSGSVF